MEKKRNNLILLTISIIFSVIIISNVSAVDCPYGFVNESYPGTCVRYVDTNQNNICDLSESASLSVPVSNITEAELKDLITGQDLKKLTVEEGADIYKIDANIFAAKLSETLGLKVNQGDSFQTLHDNNGLSPDSAKSIAIAIRLGTSTNLEVKESGVEYYMWQIAVILTLMYIVGLYLVKKQKISLMNHRKFWNFFLLITFIITAFTSIFVLLRLNYGVIFSFPLNIVFWHIEIGWIMIVISIFHTIWHLNYYKLKLTKNN